jgi:hypothetical protein
MMKTETIWIETPLLVKCLRRHHRAPASYLVFRRLPVQAPSYTSAEAPVALTYFGFAAHATTVTGCSDGSFRRVDGKWYSPIGGPAHQPLANFDTLDMLKEARSHSRRWMDNYFDLPEQAFECRKIEAMAEFDLHPKEWHSDIEAAAAAETLRLTAEIALVDGLPHRRRAAPEISVSLHDSYGWDTKPTPPSSIRIHCSLAPNGPGDRGERSVIAPQRFAADRFEVARHFARRVSRYTGAAAYENSRFDVVEAAAKPIFAETDDLDLYLHDLAARLPSTLSKYVGGLDRRLVEDFLDLRDMAEDPDRDQARFADATLALFLRASDGTPRNAHVAALLQYEAMRIEVERGGGATLFLPAEEHVVAIARLADRDAWLGEFDVAGDAEALAAIGD